MLNAHATAFRINRLYPEVGMFELEILEEKDMGAFWKIPYEDVLSYQFAANSQTQPIEKCIEIVQTIIKPNQRVVIKPSKSALQATLTAISDEQAWVDKWLRQSIIAPLDIAASLGYRQGNEELTRLLRIYLGKRRLLKMDDQLAENFVHNPYSGEDVKAHAMALAELGLAKYDGKIIRDSSVLQKRWSMANRKRHIICRLAFMRAMWSLVEQQDVSLYRAFGSPSKLIKMNHSFISATFSKEIAQMLYDSKFFKEKRLLSQPVAANRLFMTFIETKAMCKQYPEAEALLIAPKSSKEKF